MNKGFTLLEILIAVAILAASFTALLSSQASSFLAAERSEQITVATQLARSRMAEFELELEKDLAKSKFPDDNSEKTGTFEEPFEDYRWKVTVRKVELPAAAASEGEEEQAAVIASYMKNVVDQISKAVREIQVTVYWGDKEKKEEDQPHMKVTSHIVNLK